MAIKEVMSAPISGMLQNGSKMLVSRIKEIVFAKLLEQEVKYAESTTAAQMQRMLQDDTGKISSFLSYKLPGLVDGISGFVSNITSIATLSPSLMVYSIASGLAALTISQVMDDLWSFVAKPPPRKKDEERPLDNSQEALQNFNTVRIFNQQDKALEAFKKHLWYDPQDRIRKLIKMAVWPLEWASLQGLAIMAKVYGAEVSLPI